MNSLREKAWAKLNLALDVLAPRGDGYHDMRMVMQTADFWDDVTLTLRQKGDISLRCNLRYIPLDRRNIAWRAAELFFSTTGQTGLGVSIDLYKRIPAGAGLGGGSADAAAVLRGLNRLTGAPLGPEELTALAAQLGSDVPFCITGGTALAEGRGEILTDLPPLPGCTFVICKPNFSISTPALFQKIDGRKSRMRPDIDGMAAAIAAGSILETARRLYNVFEDVLPRAYGEIARIKDQLLDLGALGAVMSGTGSAVFGVFSDAGAARRARIHLSARYPHCVTAEPVPKLAV